jgi:hypothetical protein
MTQQEPLEMLARLTQNPDRGCSRADKVTHSLVRLVGYPHCSQLAGTMQLRQHDGIPAVGLDPVSRLHRDQGRSNDNARMPHL